MVGTGVTPRHAGNIALQRVLGSRAILPQLEVGSATDPLEGEADLAAEQVMAGGHAHCSCGGTCPRCREAQARRLRRSAVGDSTPVSPSSVPDEIGEALGPAQALDPGTRGALEAGFGQELGHVRIHTGAEAQEATSLVAAKAFAVGQSVAFARGMYAPHTETGRRLLAHEVAHVVQQDEGVAGRAIRRVGAADPAFGYFPAERKLIEAEKARERAEAQRHREWVQSHRERHTGSLASQATTLAEDIESSRSEIVAQRMAMIREAVGRNPTSVPVPLQLLNAPRTPDFSAIFADTVISPELGPKWALAQQHIVLLEALIEGQQLTPEDAATAGPVFHDFYQVLLPLAESKDRAEREYQAFDASFDFGPRRPQPCPSCHAPAEPPQRQRFVAPPPRGPVLRAADNLAAAARTEAEWTDSIRRFQAATGVMDTIVMSTLPATSKARQAYAYASALLERQERLAQEVPDAIKIRAVFYPKDEWYTDPESGQKLEVANGIPWFFYLTHTELKGDSYTSNFTWFLRDITTPPPRPEVSYQLGPYEAFTRSFAHLEASDPAPVLFRKLNDSLIFPEGMLYWTYPDGRPGQLETTASWSLSDWLGAIGIGLAALAIILGTGGLASGAVVAGLTVASAGFSIASTVSDLAHRSELGILTGEDKEKAVLFIAADLASVFSLGLSRTAGSLARLAAETGEVSRMTIIVRRAATAAAFGDKWLGRAVKFTIARDFYAQYRAIQNSNLPPAEREAALRRLALTGLLTGALMVASHMGDGGPHETPGAARTPQADPSDAIHFTGSGEAPTSGWSRPHGDADFLASSSKQDILPPADAGRELRIAQQEGTSRPLHDDLVYSRELSVPGAQHKWRLRRDGKGWCRWSKKRCYSNEDLGGAAQEVERVAAMNTLAEVTAFRSTELSRRPGHIRSDQDILDWADYYFYSQRRLRMIEDAIAAGKRPPNPPRTFESFRAAHPPGSEVRNRIQGDRFEQRSVERDVETFREAGMPEAAFKILRQHHISVRQFPRRRRGQITRPDSLVPWSGGTFSVVSDKSRTFIGKTPNQVRAQVRADLEEAILNHTGQQYILRHRDLGPVEINGIVLRYDAARVPEALREVIKDEIAEAKKFWRKTDLQIGVEIF